MITYDKKMLEKIVEKKVKHLYEKLEKADNDLRRIRREYESYRETMNLQEYAYEKFKKMLESEEFIDSVVDRIKKKQL